MKKENNSILNIFIVIISPIIYLIVSTIVLTYLVFTSIEYILIVTYFLLKHFLIFVHHVFTVKND